MAVGKKTALDKYADIAALVNLEAGAHTAHYMAFNFPYSIIDRIALLIHRIDYDFELLAGMAADAGACTLGISTSQVLGLIPNPLDPQIIDECTLRRSVVTGVGESLEITQTRDFNALPGGGILVAPKPLYGFIQGATANTAAMRGALRMWYTTVTLETDDFWQLVQSRNIVAG